MNSAYPPPAPPESVTPRTNVMAVLSLVLALTWLCGVGSVAAIVIAQVAQRQIRESGGKENGEGLAKAGFVLGLVGVAAVALLAAAITAVTFLGTTSEEQVRDDSIDEMVAAGIDRDLAVCVTDGLIEEFGFDDAVELNEKVERQATTPSEDERMARIGRDCVLSVYGG